MNPRHGLVVGIFALTPTLMAQATSLTLEQAVNQAWDRYPSLRVSVEQVSAAAAGIDLARKAYLPRADFLGQINRATRNNVFGLLLPQPVIPAISGPVLGRASMTNVWGTAVGALVSWEPFDFGLRAASVAAAQSARDRAGAQEALTRLEIGTAAADAFLTTLAAQQVVVAAQAGVERARVFEQSVQALVKAELRAGADASRSSAELAQARIQLIQSERAEQVSRAALTQFLGTAPGALRLEAGPLLKVPQQIDTAGRAASSHPRAVVQNAAVEVARSRQKILDRSYFPRFQLQAATYGRGTGADPDGTTGGAASGLGPNTGNWAVGMTVTFPAFDLPSIRARKQVEAFQVRAEAARYDQIIQDLTADLEKARAALDGARKVSEQTPIQLAAARTLEQQAAARYKSGLTTIVDVAEAQRLLTQAEIDNSLAGLGLWRALLALRVAEGDLTSYLQQTR